MGVRLGKGHFAAAIVLLALALVASSAVFVGSAHAASKKAVYVVTKVTEKSEYGTHDFTFSYKSNGLVKSIYDYEDVQYGPYINTYKYAYTKNNKLNAIKNLNQTDDSDANWIAYTIERNKKGQVTKCSFNDFSSSFQTFKYNSKGQLIKLKDVGSSSAYTYKIAYDKNGRIASITPNGNSSAAKTYAYDKKGNIKKVTLGSGTVYITCKNTYNKKGRLTKQVATHHWSSGSTTAYTYTFKYKKMKVKASVVEMVKKQQQSVFFGEQAGAQFVNWAGRPLLAAAN